MIQIFKIIFHYLEEVSYWQIIYKYKYMLKILHLKEIMLAKVEYSIVILIVIFNLIVAYLKIILPLMVELELMKIKDIFK